MDKMRKYLEEDNYKVVYGVPDYPDGFHIEKYSSSKEMIVAASDFDEAMEGGIENLFFVHTRTEVLRGERNKKKKAYIIKRWIPVSIKIEDDTVYKSRLDAEVEAIRLEEMQPENKYEIEEMEL